MKNLSLEASLVRYRFPRPDSALLSSLPPHIIKYN
jgi:hypothetical protein